MKSLNLLSFIFILATLFLVGSVSAQPFTQDILDCINNPLHPNYPTCDANGAPTSPLADPDNTPNIPENNPPQTDDPASGNFIPCTDDCDSADLVRLINNVINFLVFQVAIFLATVIIVWAGVLYVLYPYKPGNKELAKKMIFSAIGGLMIVLSAYIIIKFIVTSVVGQNSANDNADLVQEIMNIFDEVPDTTGN